MSEMTKRCRTCGVAKEVNSYSCDAGMADGRKSTCKTCVSAAARRALRAMRDAVLAHYGGRCACCGEGRREFLAVDHIHGGGKAHRREIHRDLTSWLVRNGFPDGFQILCHNCNMAKSIYGACPHAEQRAVSV